MICYPVVYVSSLLRLLNDVEKNACLRTINDIVDQALCCPCGCQSR